MLIKVSDPYVEMLTSMYCLYWQYARANIKISFPSYVHNF